MADLELCLFLLSLAQGLILLLFLLPALLMRILSSLLFQRGWANRRVQRSVRFFECAVYSRLNSQLRYNVQVFGIISAYLVYDLDLFFFLPEVLQWEGWAWHQAVAFFLYLGIFTFALWLDLRKGGFLWDN